MDDTFTPDKLTFYGSVLLGAGGFVLALVALFLWFVSSRRNRARAFRQQRLSAYTLTVAAEAAIQAGVRQFRLVREEASEAGLTHILPLLDPLIEQLMSTLAKVQDKQSDYAKEWEDQKIGRMDEETLEDDLAEIQEWANVALRQQRNGALIDEIRADIVRRKAGGAPKPAAVRERR